MSDVMLKNVRIAFPKLFEPKAVGDGDKKYFSLAAIIEPGSENAKACDAAVTEVAKSKWADKAAGVMKKLVEDGKVAFKKKPLTDQQGQAYDGFEGMWSLNASRPESKGRVVVIDRNKAPLSERDGKPYAGSYCNVMVSFWAQDNANGKRLNCELKAVQFVKDGDAFGGGAPASADAFDDLGADEESLV